MKRKSPDIRSAAVIAVIEGKISIQDALSVFHVSKSSLYRWIKIYKDEGRLIHKTPPGRPAILSQEQIQTIFNIVDSNPDITLEELAEHMGKIVSISTLFGVLKKGRYGYKKKHSKRQSRIEKT